MPAKRPLMLLIGGLVMAGALSKAAEKPQVVLSDFTDAETDGKKWTTGDSGAVKMSVGPRTVTETDNMLKVVFQSGKWPGFSTVPPRDWSPYEVLRFVVWSRSAVSVSIRIDDPNSTGYDTRYNRSFKLDPGRNLCQMDVRDIARTLDVKKIKALILFTSSPPPGLTLYFDDIVLGPRLTEQVPFIPYEKRKDLTATLEVVTPHLPFGRNLSGGSLRTFCITGVAYGRELSEMMQRVDMKVSQLTWDRNWDQNTWGFGDFYGQRGHRFDYVLMQRYLASSMQGPEKFDTMILCTPQGWNRFPAGARKAILARVRDKGEGLLLVFPFPGEKQHRKWQKDLRELSALVDSDTDWPEPKSGYIKYANRGRIIGEKWKITMEHPITRGVPLEAIPTESIEVMHYEPAKGASVLIETENGHPVLAVKQYGKGRVATFAWRSRALTPDIRDPEKTAANHPYRYWEAIYSLMTRAAYWTSGREFARLGEPEDVQPEPGQEDANLSARRWKDKNGRTTDWELVFVHPGETGIAAVEVNAPESVTRGEEITVNFIPPEKIQPGTTFTVTLTEKVFGRIRTLEKKNVTAGGGDEINVGLSSEKVRQPMAVVVVKGSSPGGNLTAQGRAEVLVPPAYGPNSSRWTDYEVMMWPVGGLPFLREWDDARMKDIGSTGVMFTGWRHEASCRRWARAGLRLMPHSISHRNKLHLYYFGDIISNWNRTHDKKYLVRNPSYADPEFLAKEKEYFTGVVKKLLKYNPTNFVLCDEPSLTSYAKDFDFDFHPANIEKFRRRLENKFGSMKNLNSALGTDYKNFAEIVPPITEEARKNKTWPLWNEWRQHNDLVMAEAYRMYLDIVKSIDPAGEISVSGTQSATPFDGFDWSLLSPLFGTMQGYGYNHQDIKRMSFNPEMLNATPAGYGKSGSAVDYQVWTKLTEHGCGHVIFWWIAFRNPDLSFCRSALDYKRMFHEMETGTGKQYMQARREFSPVAVIYSMNSLRAAYTEGMMEDRGGKFKDNENAVVDALSAAGYDPQFISEKDVAAGKLEEKGIRALFLPLTLSLGYGDKPGGLAVKPALEKFMESGGALVATDEFKYDEFLRPRKPDEGFAAGIISYDSIKDNLAAALAKSGVKRRITVTRPDGTPIPKLTCCVHYFPGSPGHLLTVLRPPVGSKEVVGADGVIHTVPDKSGGKEIEELVIDVSSLGKASCCDIRSGRKIEIKDGMIRVPLKAGNVLSFALLPYSIDSLEAAADVEKEDGWLNVNWRLKAAGEVTRYAPHVVRVEVGEMRGGKFVPDPALCRNRRSAPSGTGRVVLPLSQEDSNRRFVVRLHDILSGATTEIPAP